MGALTGNPEDNIQNQLDGEKDKAIEPPEGKIETEFEGVFADAVNQKDNLPVFKVSHQEFYQNMNAGRQRIRFKSGSDPQKFMRNGRYNKAFWIQHEKDGYMRKVAK
jgi:hypothetical protein